MHTSQESIYWRVVHMRDKETNCPLHYASERSHTTAVELLIDAKAPASVINDERRTPLHAAAKNGHTEAVRLLVGPSILRDDFFYTLQLY